MRSWGSSRRNFGTGLRFRQPIDLTEDPQIQDIKLVSVQPDIQLARDSTLTQTVARKVSLVLPFKAMGALVKFAEHTEQRRRPSILRPESVPLENRNLFHLVSRRLLELASVHWTIKLEDQALVHLRFAIDTRQQNPPHVCLVALVSPSSSLQAVHDFLIDPFVGSFL